VVPPGRSYFATTNGPADLDPRDVDLHADLSAGLDAYSRAARGLAVATIRGGAATGIVTFARPFTWVELATIEGLGIEVHDVEAVTKPDAQGLRWTFFGGNEPGMEAHFRAAAAESGVEPLGIVAAVVTVPDAAALERLQRSANVYLVDLSISDYIRHNPDVTDVVQNDVYWNLAGWD
jgi:hypothetical protein